MALTTRSPIILEISCSGTPSSWLSWMKWVYSNDSKHLRSIEIVHVRALLSGWRLVMLHANYNNEAQGNHIWQQQQQQHQQPEHFGCGDKKECSSIGICCDFDCTCGWERVQVHSLSMDCALPIAVVVDGIISLIYGLLILICGLSRSPQECVFI